MAGLKDVLRSIGDAFLPLEKKPTYRNWVERLRKQQPDFPSAWVPVLYGDSKAQLRLYVGIKTGREIIALAVKGKGAENYVTQSIDPATLKLLKPITQVAEPKR